tara:strand:- start:9692 stop:10531 length:840 start_codon:yes stop_codon:yes gene_type:complete
MNTKYLIYDNIIRGAGLGHTLVSYNYGLNIALSQNLVFLPPLMSLGHGLGNNGMVENFLGLNDFSTARNHARSNFPSLCDEHSYNQLKGGKPTLESFEKTRNYFMDHYKYRRLILENHLKPQVTNITVTIRRGDVAMEPHYEGSAFKTRLRPDEYYLRVLDYIIQKQNLKDFFINIYSDGDWADGYINDKGEKVNINRLFSKYKNRFNYFPSKKNAERTLTQLQNCIESDICIASISGFSQIIGLYKTHGSIIFPGDHKVAEYGDPERFDYFSGPELTS